MSSDERVGPRDRSIDIINIGRWSMYESNISVRVVPPVDTDNPCVLFVDESNNCKCLLNYLVL